MSDEEAVGTADPLADVLRNRRKEALKAGMSMADAAEWAVGLSDCGALRKLVKKNCPPALLARILN